jgi:hypothetical protein
VTNGERADRLIGEARQIAGEMQRALDDEAWNHPAPVFAHVVRPVASMSTLVCWIL